MISLEKQRSLDTGYLACMKKMKLNKLLYKIIQVIRKKKIQGNYFELKFENQFILLLVLSNYFVFYWWVIVKLLIVFENNKKVRTSRNNTFTVKTLTNYQSNTQSGENLQRMQIHLQNAQWFFWNTLTLSMQYLGLDQFAMQLQRCLWKSA